MPWEKRLYIALASLLLLIPCLLAIAIGGYLFIGVLQVFVEQVFG